MQPRDPTPLNPAVPILLNKLRTGDEHDRRVAADVLTALNPEYAEIPDLLAELIAGGRELQDSDGLDHGLLVAAERFVGLVGREATESIPVLIRGLVDDLSYGSELAVFGPAGCDALLEAFDIYSQCDEELLCRILSSLAFVVGAAPECVTPSLIGEMAHVVECFDGFCVRDAACGVLCACAGQKAALLAVAALLIYLQEARRLGLEESVAAATDALEAIDPDDPDVREALDSVDEE